ncbi:MAG: cobyric acid synthase [Deltaproteobacteria bacterium]|nr:cobyric acid synthase [Deltaproteobacteria bacterium]
MSGINFRHGGNIIKLAREAGLEQGNLLDFSANINPLGPPDWFRPLVSSRLSSLVHYPDPDCSRLLEIMARRFQVDPQEILIGNGSTELLYLLPRVLPVSRALIAVPAYVDYAKALHLAGLAVHYHDQKEKNGFRLVVSDLESGLTGGELVVLGQPNNPTGLAVDPQEIRSLAGRHPETFFLVDEAFADFVDNLESLAGRRPPNVIVLQSFTKFYAIPGLRLGAAVLTPTWAEKVREVLPPWSVNTLAQQVGEAALQDLEYGHQTRRLVREQRGLLSGLLSGLPQLTVYPGEANFLFLRLDHPVLTARDLAQRLLTQGLAIRVCDNYEGLDERFFRVAVRTANENRRLAAVLEAVLTARPVPKVTRQKTPALMFQGTSSNAGKSLLTAALCRILLQDGYRVAPFKSQNMSLNSFVTQDGGEMGRAQVVQAQASRLDPDVRMNPVLLKPSSDTGAQVIVLGRPVGNMDVNQYIDYKPQAFAQARAAYDSLAREFDVIVLEGAGSPAEVNLKHHDIVNMRMAEYAEAPVLLVGDIDRGGVFASFIGTLEVLAEWERRLLAGFIVNRFRGQEELLEPAFRYTERHTGLPVLGTVPYLKDHGLPEEDSVSYKSGAFDRSEDREAGIEIALIDLPHISNFTDFDALRIEPDVHLRIVRSPADLNQPDAVILPGSKNVIGDLLYLRESGLDRRLNRLAEEGRTEIVGVCGGFQLLGREIADPYGIESGGRTLEGLGLLPVSTILEKEKTLERVQARHLPTGLPIFGYEIHHGRTEGQGLTPIVQREDGETIGLGRENGRIWGTYLHGAFDADAFRRWFIDRLRSRRGLEAVGAIRAVYDLEPALDRLADAVRRSLQMKTIYKLMGLK